MSTLVHAGPIRTATMHRDDAPIGRTARLHLRKRFGGLCCRRRSWSDNGKRLFLQGYQLTFHIEFACAEAEPDKGRVLRKRHLREIRAALRRQFEDTTLIASNDPQRELFEMLAGRGMVDIRIMDSTAVEASAAWVFDAVEGIVAAATRGRVWVSRIDAVENGANLTALRALPVTESRPVRRPDGGGRLIGEGRWPLPQEHQSPAATRR